MKLKLLFFITFFFPCLAFAQSAGTVKGSVVGAVSNEPVPGVIVTLTGQDRKIIPMQTVISFSVICSREAMSYSSTPY